MRIFRGPIARLVVFSFASIALLATAIVGISVISSRRNLALADNARQRSEVALLSARLRSESLVLTDLVESFIYHIPGQATSRDEITAQSQKLDELIQDAIKKINPNDVDETLELGTIRQRLIAFSIQSNRVLESFDNEQMVGEETAREFRFLVESYQIPLIESLQRFENYETRKATESLGEINRLANSVANLMLIAAAISSVTAIIVIQQTATRFVFPLVRLQTGVRHMRANDLDWQIDIQSKDEMGNLAQALNQMASDLRTSQAQLKEYANTLEEQVHARTAELRKLTIAVEQSPSSVVISDTNGRIQYVNPRFTNLTGYTPEEVIGKTSSILQSGLTPREIYTDLWNTITAGKLWKGEFINRKKNGDLYWEETLISPVLDENGEITHYIAIKENITHRKEAEVELRRLATIDPLTEAFNRRQFHLLSEYALAEAERYHTSLSAMMIDVDHFKNVNDTYGHHVGDEVLRTLVEIIREQIREADILGRYGGEEFALIMPHTQLDHAQKMGERIRTRISEHEFETEQGSFKITISIGVAEWSPKIGTDIDQMIQNADVALYNAKQSGRNRVITYDPADTIKRKNSSEGNSHD